MRTGPNRKGAYTNISEVLSVLTAFALHSREAADEWLDHLGGVHDLFYECESRCQRRLGEAATKAARVKVAVLDTGLQLPGALRENYEDEGRISFRHSGAFIPVTGETSTHGWNVDRDGHGSRVGQIVLQVAPAADLHVAKVFETRDDLADPHRAEQAHRRIAEASFPLKTFV